MRRAACSGHQTWYRWIVDWSLGLPGPRIELWQICMKNTAISRAVSLLDSDVFERSLRRERRGQNGTSSCVSMRRVQSPNSTECVIRLRTTTKTGNVGVERSLWAEGQMQRCLGYSSWGGTMITEEPHAGVAHEIGRVDTQDTRVYGEC